jgi:HEAT repeat protein
MILLVTLVVWSASAQASKPPSPVKPSRPAAKPVSTESPSPKALVEQARAARSKGDTKAALRLVDEAIEKQPTFRDAAALKIDLSATAGDLPGAFAAYDRYVASSQGRGDRALLAPIGRGALRELRSNDLTEVRAAALAALAASGDAAARKELERATATKDSPPPSAVDAALARLGDETAAARFADRIRQGGLPARLSAIEASKDFTTSPPAVTRALVAALGDKDNVVRAAAAQAVGRLKIAEAVPVLRRALGEPGSYLVRISAAASLHRLGDPAGDELLGQALAGDIVEAKAFAASAYAPGESAIWRPTMESVLARSTGIDALTAAEVLLAVDSPAARQQVDQAASDANPSIRAQAARIAGRQPEASASTVRRLLEDDSPLVRFYVAEGLLRSERPATLTR